MKNADQWVPSKFTYRGDWLRASRDRRSVAVTSRVMVDCIASWYQRALPRFASGDLVDLGCGKVPLYGVYRDLVRSVTCADWGNSPHSSPHLDIDCDLSRRLPFDNNRFDTALLSDVLEHLAEPIIIWQELSRVVRPKGRVILNVPFLYWIHESPYDYYRYTEYSLRRLATEHGFDVEELSPLGGAPEVLSDILLKTVAFVPKIGTAMSIGMQGALSLSLKAIPVQKLSRRTEKVLPLAYAMVARRR